MQLCNVTKSRIVVASAALLALCRQMNDDEMASFKLAEGIRKFAQDLVKLEQEITKRMQSAPNAAPAPKL